MTGRQDRALLGGGVLATPLFFIVAFAQIAMRDGFDLGPHMISQLATGEGGWLQIVNFVVAGTLFVLAAVGIRRASPPDQRWVSRLIAVFGTGLVMAGIFVTDPANGYPVGAAAETTWHGILHGVSAAAAGLALVAASWVQARRWFKAGERAWAVAGIAIGLGYIVLPFTLPGQEGLMFAVASAIGWGWISVIIGRSMMRRASVTRTVGLPQAVHP